MDSARRRDVRNPACRFAVATGSGALYHAFRTCGSVPPIHTPFSRGLISSMTKFIQASTSAIQTIDVVCPSPGKTPINVSYAIRAALFINNTSVSISSSCSHSTAGQAAGQLSVSIRQQFVACSATSSVYVITVCNGYIYFSTSSKLKLASWLLNGVTFLLLELRCALCSASEVFVAPTEPPALFSRFISVENFYQCFSYAAMSYHRIRKYTSLASFR